MTRSIIIGVIAGTVIAIALQVIAPGLSGLQGLEIVLSVLIINGIGRKFA